LLSIPNRAILNAVHKSAAERVAISRFSGILAAEGSIVTSETERQMWIEAWARRIETLGLSPVALPLIEIVRAFGFLGSQALLMAQPLVTGIVDDAAFERTVALLDSPQLLERLRVCLEGEES
jgi:hypothetical protein